MPSRLPSRLLCVLITLAVTVVLAPVSARSAPAPRSAAGATEPADPQLPEPRFQSVSREVLITMDDGVELAATIAFPSRDGETRIEDRRPVVFGMTPYGRNGLCGCFAPDFWATRGMIGAAVDVRGTGGSGGDLSGNYFSPRESRDGHDLIEWFGTRDWSNGKVGMAGGSYVGITQLLAAARRPRHLAAIAPAVALSDVYRDAYTHGAVPNQFFDAQYVGVQGGPGTASTNTDPALLQHSVEAKLGQSPPLTPAFDYLARPDDGRFYRHRSPIYRADRIEVPTLLLGGWRDGLSQRGAPELYRVLSRRAGVETRMVMGPCTHKGCGGPFAPLTDPENQPDQVALTFEFMERHLLGSDTPRRSPVSYHVQGADRQRTAASWPPPGMELQRFSLTPGRLRQGGGDATGSADYVTNPAAGFSLAFNQYGTVAASPYVPLDQRLEGPHGLTFRTSALEDPMTLAGPLALRLVAASTAPDTDWHAKLSDVAPDGSETIITEGALRASHRRLDREKSTPARPYHPHTDPTPIEPGRFYRYAIELWPTAWRLAPGHRLQLRVTSTDLPTHLPGGFRVDPSDPASLAIDFHQPAVNTVRYAGSELIVPVLTAAQPPARARSSATIRSGSSAE